MRIIEPAKQHGIWLHVHELGHIDWHHFEEHDGVSYPVLRDHGACVCFTALKSSSMLFSRAQYTVDAGPRFNDEETRIWDLLMLRAYVNKGRIDYAEDNWKERAHRRLQQLMDKRDIKDTMDISFPKFSSHNRTWFVTLPVPDPKTDTSKTRVPAAWLLNWLLRQGAGHTYIDVPVHAPPYDGEYMECIRVRPRGVTAIHQALNKFKEDYANDRLAAGLRDDLPRTFAEEPWTPLLRLRTGHEPCGLDAARQEGSSDLVPPA